MSKINPKELWFNTPDTETLCRAGGNGPDHPTQLYAIKKYVEDGIRFLDYGCGSATTLEALKKDGWIIIKGSYGVDMPVFGHGNKIEYKGVDIIPKNIEWCKENYPEGDWEVNKSIHKIDQPDKSFDVVYSRHVVDHMRSFEDAMDEHKRVADKLVIVVLWTGLLDGDEHEIKNIVDQRGLPTEKTYLDEYTNNYSRKKVKEYLEGDTEWKLLELTEGVGKEVKGWDTVLVLQKSS